MKDRPEGPGWHRKAVIGGESWSHGLNQLNFLIARGLGPAHRFLDIGCGSFRLGVHAIGYLERGHYYAVDATAELIEAGVQEELRSRGLLARSPHIRVMGDFDFRSLRCSPGFDFAWAYSLFTHLRPWSIRRCLEEVAKVLAPKGQLFASFNEAVGSMPESLGDEQSWPKHYNGCTYSLRRMQSLAASAGLQVDRARDWGLDVYAGRDHLQRMLCFRRPSS